MTEEEGIKHIQDFLREFGAISVAYGVTALVFRIKDAEISVSGNTIKLNGIDFKPLKPRDLDRLVRSSGIDRGDVQQTDGFTDQGLQQYANLVVQSMRKYGIARMWPQKVGATLGWQRISGRDAFSSTDINFALIQQA